MQNTFGMMTSKIMKIVNRNSNTIEFICEDADLDYFSKPLPSSKNIPEWYKKLTTHIDNKKTYSDGHANSTVKKCMPVFDAMTSGYLITFPCDVVVTRNPDGSPAFSWPIQFKMVNQHSYEQASTLKVPSEYGPEFLKWSNPWIIKMPKGWSVLFVQPMHRDDLPFSILPGIVDADGFKLSVQFPFLLRKDFVGVIPAGTPMAQIIPIKRSDWVAEYSSIERRESQKNLEHHSIYLENRYKRTFWNKKNYK